MDLPNKTELFERMIEEAIAFHNGKLTETTMRQEGTDANSLLMAGVALGDEICYQIYLAIKNSNPQTAEQEDLDKLLFDWFSLTRLAASSSITTLKFERSGTTEGIIPAGYICSTNNGINFATDIDLIFGVTDLTGSVQATAVLSGPDSNVAINTIIKMQQPQFDNTFTVTNIERAVGGKEQETDSQFRRRAAEYWTVQQKGTKEAIIYGAKTVPGVSEVSLIEQETGVDVKTRYVQLIVADASGGSNTLLKTNVKNELENWRAAGVWVEVLGGTASNIAIYVNFDYKAGFSQSTINANVRKALVAYVNSRKLGEPLYIDILKSIVENVNGVFGNVEIVLPAANIFPTNIQILKTSENLILINV